MTERRIDGGWSAFEDEYIRSVDEGDPARTRLLDDVMLAECGDVEGKVILDVGAGEGRFSRMLETRGARPLAVDLTWQMVRAVRDRSDGRIPVGRASAAALPIASASVDTVVSYIVWVDVADFRAAIAEAARVLKSGGSLVAANLGFITASDGWTRAPDGKRLSRPVDDYADERPITFNWRGHLLTNWHRPLSAYMDAYLSSGLTLRRYLEPVPDDQSLRDDPRFEDWFRVPEFTVMRWEKP